MSTPLAHRSARPASPAFTIMEMLVVIVILGILIGLIIGLAQRVTAGGKASSTKNLIQTMDTIVTEYTTFKEGQVPAWVRTKQTQVNPDDTSSDVLAPEEYIFPLIDGRYTDRVIAGGTADRFDPKLDPAQPAAALFLLAAAEAIEAKKYIQKINPAFLVRRDVWAYGWLIGPAGEPIGAPVRCRLRIPVPTDAYGSELRMCHPAFHGGYGQYFYQNADASAWIQSGADQQHPSRSDKQFAPQSAASVTARMFSRSYRPFNPTSTSPTAVGDADEGTCVGNRVYFYSPGLDADPGTRTDNVYNTVPSFPRDNDGLN